MKKTKIFALLSLITLTCTGCTVEYNIKITKDNVEEVINVNDKVSSTRTKEDILKEYNIWYPTYVNFITEGETIEIEDFSYKTEGVEYHQKQIENLDNGYNYTYSYIYPIGKYYDAYILARTFLETTVYEGNDNLVIKTSDKNFLCDYDYFEKVKVNITIDPEVYELNYTNTSNINNNTYTWVLDRSNCENSKIVLTLDTKNNYNVTTNSDINNNNADSNNNIKKTTDYTMYIFCGILILVIIIGYFISKKIKEKSEKFDLDD